MVCVRARAPHPIPVGDGGPPLVVTGNRAVRVDTRRTASAGEGVLRQADPLPVGWADAVLFGVLKGEIS